MTFEDAGHVFFDPARASSIDQVIEGEERWHTVGKVEGLLLLLGVHAMWEESSTGDWAEVVRIISA